MLFRSLLGGLEVMRDGKPQGHLRIYGSAVADAMPGDDRAGLDPVAHWKVRNHAMRASVTAGADADHLGAAARPGPYRVLHTRAPLLDDAHHPQPGKTLAHGAVVLSGGSVRWQRMRGAAAAMSTPSRSTALPPLDGSDPAGLWRQIGRAHV